MRATSLVYFLVFALFRDSQQQIGSGVGIKSGGGTKCQPVWSNWENWSPCPAGPVAPHENAQTRRRFCQYFPEGCSAPTGADCTDSGFHVQQQECPVLVHCRVEGVWSPWSGWTECPDPAEITSDSPAYKYRQRICVNFPAGCLSDVSAKCSEGNAIDYQQCLPPTTPPPQCQFNGVWAVWSAWSACPKEVDTPSKFIQQRQRNCQGVPAGCVATIAPSCGAAAREKRFCPCTSKGEWIHWSEWSACFGKPYRSYRYRRCRASPQSCIPNPNVIPQCA